MVTAIQSKVKSLYNYSSPSTILPIIPEEEEESHSKKDLNLDQQLENIGAEWNNVLLDIEKQSHENEEMFKKWWNFSRSKKRIMRWMENKEKDAMTSYPHASYNDTLASARKFEVCLHKLAHFSSVLCFMICFSEQNERLVSIWNATLDWIGLIKLHLEIN